MEKMSSSNTPKENVIVKSSAWQAEDLLMMFGPFPAVLTFEAYTEIRDSIHFTEARDLPNLLKELGIYKTTSDARRAGRGGPIPQGWTELKASKIRKIWIWNPTIGPLASNNDEATKFVNALEALKGIRKG